MVANRWKRILLMFWLLKRGHGFCASRNSNLALSPRVAVRTDPFCFIASQRSAHRQTRRDIDNDHSGDVRDTSSFQKQATAAASLHKHVSTHPDGSTIMDHRQTFWKLTRPSSLPGIVMFHMLGVYLALGDSPSNNYWAFLLYQPGLWLTLLAIIHVSSTSMLINDYYDAKLGRDALKLQQLNKHKALVEGDISLPLTKRFLTYLYAMALVITSFLPGAFTRLLVNGGLMLTYLYTVHLKPIPIVKNVVCALLVALAPLTSGSATVALMVQKQTSVWSVKPLWRLFGALFCGIMARELMMDCNDIVTDRAAGIRTVPVLWGCTQASALSLLVTSIMALILCIPPGIEIWQARRLASHHTAVLTRLALAFGASGWTFWRSWQVFRSEGKEQAVIHRAVTDGLFTVALLLASFI